MRKFKVAVMLLLVSTLALIATEVYANFTLSESKDTEIWADPALPEEIKGITPVRLACWVTVAFGWIAVVFYKRRSDYANK